MILCLLGFLTFELTLRSILFHLELKNFHHFIDSEVKVVAIVGFILVMFTEWWDRRPSSRGLQIIYITARSVGSLIVGIAAILDIWKGKNLPNTLQQALSAVVMFLCGLIIVYASRSIRSSRKTNEHLEDTNGSIISKLLEFVTVVTALSAILFLRLGDVSQTQNNTQELVHIHCQCSPGGLHWGIIVSIALSFLVGIVTLSLFWKQGKTMEKQITLNSRLVAVEESRDQQANQISCFVEVEVNYEAFELANGVPVSFEQAVLVRIQVINDSNLPAYKLDLHFKNGGDRRREPGVPQVYFELFGALGPHRKKTFQVSSKLIDDESFFHGQNFTSSREVEKIIGLMEDDYSVSLTFKDSSGEMHGRDWTGLLVSLEELNFRLDEFFPPNSVHLDGYWLPGK